MTTYSFPQGFVWGTATAGHQNEGDNTNSDTWFLEHVTPSVFREPSGKACNTWELWRDDLALVAGMGMNAFRFSVEWARVEPQRGVFDEAALGHYREIAETCRSLGLAPVVTFNHFTAPHWFACRGAWLHPDAADDFARYCTKVTESFGHLMAYGVTLNEPNLPRLLSWFNLPQFIRDLELATLDAASKAAGVERYVATNVVRPEDFDPIQEGLTAGHRAAVAAIKAVRPDLPVGLSLAIMDDIVVGDDASFRDRKRADCYEHWLNVARDDDFIGVQNYEQIAYDGNGVVEPGPDVERNQMGSASIPASLAGAVRYAHERSGVPVLVTEHGMATRDDSQRASFIGPALVALHQTMGDGVPVLGYLHWTLLDNFEWIFGYESQLGLHSVDRSTFVRTAKPSAAVLAGIVRANAVEG